MKTVNLITFGGSHHHHYHSRGNDFTPILRNYSVVASNIQLAEVTPVIVREGAAEEERAGVGGKEL